MTASGRDYSLIGPESDRAFERGLAEGTWFQANVDPERMRQLTERRNLRPLIDALVWLGLIVGFGVLAWSLRGSWWAVPAFIAYAAVAGGAADARWHESGHAGLTSGITPTPSSWAVTPKSSFLGPRLWDGWHGRSPTFRVAGRSCGRS